MLPLDLDLVLGADVLLLQLRAAVLMDHVEGDRGRATPRWNRCSTGRRRDRRKSWRYRWIVQAYRILQRDSNAKTNLDMDASKDAKSDLLSAYRAKRSPDRTPEPFGGRRSRARQALRGPQARRHAAPLRSPSRDGGRSALVGRARRAPRTTPGDKRLAVHVEDHPLEYGDFEGIIPKGNYGAGAVIVWDRGEWVAARGPDRGSAQGQAAVRPQGLQAPRHAGPW